MLIGKVSRSILFSLNPGVLDDAPHSWIATTHTKTDDAADEVERAVTKQFSNVSAVSVKEAVATAQRVIGLLGGAVSLPPLLPYGHRCACWNSCQQ